MHDRVAAVWLLLVALGLLLGLVVVVVALGVARHLRRSRRGEPRSPTRSPRDPSDDIERPGGPQRTRRVDDEDDDS